MRYSPLLTDLYELTMLAGYLEEGMHETPAVFDLFFRQNPFMGGYAVFAGLETALSYLEGLHFNDDELAYLRTTKGSALETGQIHKSSHLFLDYKIARIQGFGANKNNSLFP